MSNKKAATKETVSFRISDRLREEVEVYREENDLSKADAYRGLVRKGLDCEDFEERFGELTEMLARIEEEVENDDDKSLFNLLSR